MRTAHLTAASVVALLPAPPQPSSELVGTRGVEQIAKDQAAVGERKRALRQSARDASNALVELGNRHLVLGHIHPRWLREEVARRLDAGEDVDSARLAELRAAGRPS